MYVCVFAYPNTVEPLWKDQECLPKVANLVHFHSLQIMFILPLTTGHLF